MQRSISATDFPHADEPSAKRQKHDTVWCLRERKQLPSYETFKSQLVYHILKSPSEVIMERPELPFKALQWLDTFNVSKGKWSLFAALRFDQEEAQVLRSPLVSYFADHPPAEQTAAEALIQASRLGHSESVTWLLNTFWGSEGLEHGIAEAFIAGICATGSIPALQQLWMFGGIYDIEAAATAMIKLPRSQELMCTWLLEEVILDPDEIWFVRACARGNLWLAQLLFKVMEDTAYDVLPEAILWACRKGRAKTLEWLLSLDFEEDDCDQDEIFKTAFDHPAVLQVLCTSWCKNYDNSDWQAVYNRALKNKKLDAMIFLKLFRPDIDACGPDLCHLSSNLALYRASGEPDLLAIVNWLCVQQSRKVDDT